MKIFIKLAVILIIPLVGCSDSNNTKNLDLTSDEYWRDYDATILFDIDSEDGAYGVILVRGHVTSGGLSIDNTPVVIDSWSYSGTVNYSSAWFYFNENIDLSASHSFNFISNVKSVSGTIKFPQSLVMTWPEVAYSNKNFEFNWQVTESPSTYIFGMDAEDEDYNEVEMEKQIDGEERSAKIEYKLFQSYPIYFEVYIYPTNIFEKDECLVVSSIDSYDFEQEYLGEYGVTKNKVTTNRILSKHRTHKHPLLKNVRVR